MMCSMILAHYSMEHSDINNIIIGGDFNTDLHRDTSLNTRALYQFITNEDCVVCDSFDNAEVLHM